MVKVEIDKRTPLDRALKIFKQKIQKSGMIKELRSRQEFVKPSVKRRKIVQKAKYRQQKFGF